jgi:Flp pilus assembly pilin Flp
MFGVLKTVLRKEGRFTAVEYGIMVTQALITVVQMMMKTQVFI